MATKTASEMRAIHDRASWDGVPGYSVGGQGASVIHRHNFETMARWAKGGFKVQIRYENSDRPIAYCDGTSEDEEELRAIAEEEDAELPPIQRRILKTGREIWTIAAIGPVDDVEDD